MPIYLATWTVFLLLFLINFAFAADTTDPTTPTGLTIYNLKDITFSIKWTKSTDDVAVNYYHIDIATGPQFYGNQMVDGWNNKWQSAGYPQLSVPDLEPNTTYYVRVWATDAAGNASPKTATVSAKTLPPIPRDLYVKSVEYNVMNQMTRIEYGNRDITTNTYDALTFRLMRILTVNKAAVKIQDLSYTYDSGGNILSIADAITGINQSFKYDELNRLTSSSGGRYGAKTYQYDQIGNIVAKDGRTYFYAEGGAGPHAVTHLSDGSSFTYDKNGNMATQQKGADLQVFQYDVEDRLVKVAKNGQTSATYDYDDHGGRITKQVGTTISVFVGQMYEQTALVKTKVVFLSGLKVVSIVGDQILYTHSDHLGGAHVVSNEAGQVREITEYDPYGALARQDRYGTPEETAKWYFAGHRLDPETSLIYMGARYYNPALGRFLTPDSTVSNPAVPSTLNRYTYANNNPVNLLDPGGQSFWKSVKSWFKQTVGIAIMVLSTMIGQPWIGAIVASAVSTAVNGGTFANFAVGVGIGFAAGWAGGFGGGLLGNTLGLSRSGAGMAVLRGAAAGSVAGAGSAAIFKGDVAMGALMGAGVGAATSSMVWKVNDTGAQAFIDKIEWDSAVGPEQKAHITEAFRAFGQDPTGAHEMSRFMASGKSFNFTNKTDQGLLANVTNNTMKIKDIDIGSFRRGEHGVDRSQYGWDNVVAHEFHHLAALHDLPDMNYGEVMAHWRSNPNHPIYDPQNIAYSENPYNRWNGISGVAFQNGSPVPAKQWSIPY